jgi:hypothetical protein
MYLQLTQNEVCAIPRNREAYTLEDGTVVEATTEQYFWLPIKRLPNTEQVIWVADGTDVGSLVTTTPTVTVDGVTTDADFQSELNAQCLQYLASTDWYITRNTETSTDIPTDVLAKRQLARDSVIQ